MADNDEIIDLTNSYTLADHFNLNNVIINLDTDDSIREEVSNQSNILNNATRNGRKRRMKKTRATGYLENVTDYLENTSVYRGTATRNLGTAVHNLCTPEIKNRKRTRQSKKASEKTTVTEEPVEEPKVKKARQEPIFCPICFEEFKGQPLGSTSCGHVFCLQCLKQALKRDSKCPTCRTKLKGSSKYHPIFL